MNLVAGALILRVLSKRRQVFDRGRHPVTCRRDSRSLDCGCRLVDTKDEIDGISTGCFQSETLSFIVFAMARSLLRSTNVANEAKPKTMIVTGASQGIGAGITKAFIQRGYNVVANARAFSNSGFAPGQNLALVEGNIGKASTAANIVDTAISRFGSIDGVVNNAGIYFTKAFTDFTTEDFERLSETNLEGYIYITQLAVKRMLAQKTGGSVTCISSAMVNHPIAGVNASIPMMTKGGLEAITRSLAMEYAKEGIRFNAVAPSAVDSPMHAGESREVVQGLTPTGTLPSIDDIVEAVVYLTEARQVTGEVLHVDAGVHNGKW